MRRLIPKYLNASGALRPDATYVASPYVEERIPYTPKLGEQIIRVLGKPVVVKHEPTYVSTPSSTKMTSTEKDVARRQAEKEVNDRKMAEGEKKADAFLKLTMPHTYIAPFFLEGDYMDNFGNGIGTWNGDLALDMITFSLPSMAKSGLTGWQRMIMNRTPTFKSISLNSNPNSSWSKYVKDGKWDLEAVGRDIGTGLKAAVEFYEHPTREMVESRNERLAHLLSETNPRLAGYEKMKLDRPTLVKAPRTYRHYVKNSNPHEDASVSRDGSEMKFYQSSADLPRNSFHEHLHTGKLGEPYEKLPEETFEQYVQRVKAHSILRDHLKDKMFLTWEEIPVSQRMNFKNLVDYMDSGGEAFVNLAEIGKVHGIALGAKYPGDAAVQQIMRDIQNNPVLQNKKDILKLVRNTPESRKYLWRALTGTLMSTVPITAIFSNNEE